MQPLEQQGPAPRVGPQQPDDAVAVPVLQGERLVLGLVVAVEAHLEHGRLAVGGADRRHQRAEAVPEVVAVAGQLPLVEHADEGRRQPVEPARPVGAEPRCSSRPAGRTIGMPVIVAAAGPVRVSATAPSLGA